MIALEITVTFPTPLTSCAALQSHTHISTAVPHQYHPTSQGEQREALIIPMEPNLTEKKNQQALNISGIPRVIQECF